MLRRLGPGAMRIAARHDDQAVLVEQPLRAGQHQELTLRLSADSARVSGVVVWDDGAPAGGVQVRADQFGQFTREIIVQTAADGAFTIGPFVKGDVCLLATGPGEQVASSGGTTPPPRQANLTLAAGEQRTGVRLVVPRRTGLIRGRVVELDGQPIAGAAVNAAFETEPGRAAGKRSSDSARAVSGPEGDFSLEFLRQGTYTLWFAAPDHPGSERIGVPVGSDLRVQLAAAGSLAGVFVAADGRAVASYTLVAVPPGPEHLAQRFASATSDQRSRQVSDPGGAFRVEGLDAGDQVLVASASDGRSAMLKVSLAPGEQKTGLRLVAAPPLAVCGRVVDAASDQPVAGVEIVLHAGFDLLRGTTDPRGAFQFDRVPTVMGIVGQAESKAHAREDFIVPAGKDGRADAGTIRLRRRQ